MNRPDLDAVSGLSTGSQKAGELKPSEIACAALQLNQIRLDFRPIYCGAEPKGQKQKDHVPVASDWAAKKWPMEPAKSGGSGGSGGSGAGPRAESQRSEWSRETKALPALRRH